MYLRYCQWKELKNQLTWNIRLWQQLSCITFGPQDYLCETVTFWNYVLELPHQSVLVAQSSYCPGQHRHRLYCRLNRFWIVVTTYGVSKLYSSSRCRNVKTRSEWHKLIMLIMMYLNTGWEQGWVSAERHKSCVRRFNHKTCRPVMVWITMQISRTVCVSEHRIYKQNYVVVQRGKLRSNRATSLPLSYIFRSSNPLVLRYMFN